MANNRRPGVFIEEVLRPSYAIPSTNSATGVFIGPHFQGPTDAPVLITSWSQFLLTFGGFPDTSQGQAFSYLPHAVFQFFNNGGRQCYVVRTVHSDAVAASRSKNDRAATPQATLLVTAKNPGVWGNNIYLDVVDRDADNGRFDFIIKYGGTANSNIVERWLDVSMDENSDRYILNLVNSSRSPSNYVVLANQNSTSPFPTNTPRAINGVQPTGGADGSTPTTSDLNSSLDLFDNVPGPFILNYPGEFRTEVIQNALTKGEERQDIFVIVDTESGLTNADDVITFVTTLVPASSYGAVYSPWIIVPDPSSTTPGATRLLPPGGFVMGKYAETDAQRGVYKAPAGLGTRILNVLDVETKFTSDELDSLNGNNVNVIRFPGPSMGFCIMGARTLKLTGDDMYISVRRSLIFLEKALIDGTQWALFEPNDPGLWSALDTSISQFLRDFWKIGGLKGATPAEAFYVKCDADINTPQVIDSGEVRIEVGVATQKPTEFVVIRIGMWTGGNSVSETNIVNQ